LPNTGLPRLLYLLYLSRPTGYRLVYRAIHRQHPRKILQLGVGNVQAGLRMIEVASRSTPPSQLCFTGIDPFEARSAADGPGVTLKMAHRLLSATGARVRLIPGEPSAVLAQVANSLGKVDLMVISGRLAPAQLVHAWFYVPRLLEEQSQVFLERLLPGGLASLSPVARAEIEALATATRRAA
jgi:hypothetical protein